MTNKELNDLIQKKLVEFCEEDAKKIEEMKRMRAELDRLFRLRSND